MKTIHKYQVPIGDETVIVPMPHGSKILKLDIQRGVPCIWAIVDTAQAAEEYKFVWRGTGHDCEKLTSGEYVGSVLIEGGSLVFHLFQVWR